MRRFHRRDEPVAALQHFQGWSFWPSGQPLPQAACAACHSEVLWLFGGQCGAYFHQQ